MAANTQVAKTATQTLGNSVVSGDQNVESSSGKIVQVQTQNSKVLADTVQKVTINDTPPWVLLLLVVGWILPTPNQIARYISETIKSWLKKIPVWKK